MKRLTAIISTTALALGATLAASTAAEAAPADCPSGSFCVWTEPDFGGTRIDYDADDSDWDEGLLHQDSSWVNRAASGPGVKDHVMIYEGPDFTGRVTMCLAPGQEVPQDAAANDMGASHRWVSSCDMEPAGGGAVEGSATTSTGIG
ncbi:peptidase inhibitor family I36 protein [Actinomycetota bacterium Odt1-20B]